MRRLSVRLGVALITFLIGLAIASIGFRRETVNSERVLFGPPCTSGVVSVEEQSEAPLRISISDTACQDSHSANVQFVVENVDSRAIVNYEIRSIMMYDGLVDDGLGVLATGVAHFQPHETREGFLGGGVQEVGQLKGFQLTVWSVLFADGTKWNRESRR